MPPFHFFSVFCSDLQQSTLDRKKKNFTFSRKFPFMKSKDDKNEDGSDQERKYLLQFDLYFVLTSITIWQIQFSIQSMHHILN